jgi:ParB-like chromosome segregation protein Spo0J
MLVHNPNNLPLIDYNELIPIQGNLKELSKTNADKLYKSFIQHGFFVPMFIWYNEDKYKIIDGHQRLKILQDQKIIFKNTGTKIPCLIVEAKNLKDAKVKLAKISSQYGTITYKGWEDFTADLNEAELLEAVAYDAFNFIDSKTEYKDGKEEGLSNINTNNTCPRCGYEW